MSNLFPTLRKMIGIHLFLLTSSLCLFGNFGPITLICCSLALLLFDDNDFNFDRIRSLIVKYAVFCCILGAWPVYCYMTGKLKQNIFSFSLNQLFFLNNPYWMHTYLGLSLLFAILVYVANFSDIFQEDEEHFKLHYFVFGVVQSTAYMLIFVAYSILTFYIVMSDVKMADGTKVYAQIGSVMSRFTEPFFISNSYKIFDKCNCQAKRKEIEIILEGKEETELKWLYKPQTGTSVPVLFGLQPKLEWVCRETANRGKADFEGWLWIVLQKVSTGNKIVLDLFDYTVNSPKESKILSR